MSFRHCFYKYKHNTIITPQYVVLSVRPPQQIIYLPQSSPFLSIDMSDPYVIPTFLHFVPSPELHNSKKQVNLCIVMSLYFYQPQIATTPYSK